jgi:hypothetical protein
MGGVEHKNSLLGGSIAADQRAGGSHIHDQIPRSVMTIVAERRGDDACTKWQ